MKTLPSIKAMRKMAKIVKVKFSELLKLTRDFRRMFQRKAIKGTFIQENWLNLVRNSDLCSFLFPYPFYIHLPAP